MKQILQNLKTGATGLGLIGLLAVQLLKAQGCRVLSPKGTVPMRGQSPASLSLINPTVKAN